MPDNVHCPWINLGQAVNISVSHRNVCWKSLNWNRSVSAVCFHIATFRCRTSSFLFILGERWTPSALIHAPLGIHLINASLFATHTHQVRCRACMWLLLRWCPVNPPHFTKQHLLLLLLLLLLLHMAERRRRSLPVGSTSVRHFLGRLGWRNIPCQNCVSRTLWTFRSRLCTGLKLENSAAETMTPV